MGTSTMLYMGMNDQAHGYKLSRGWFSQKLISQRDLESKTDHNMPSITRYALQLLSASEMK